ncbi:MAG: stage II sporulation protein M [Deltaproteobacteria bacterium]|nr:stage II sporulation protein M [Deltaproteobacteria bacterium]
MDGASQSVLRSFEFRKERESSWKELEYLVEKVEKRGVKSLTADELSRLPVLYRATLSSLSVARNISLDQNVVKYLESLAGRAYFTVYGSKRHLFDAVSGFFLYQFPTAVRKAKWALLLSFAFLMLGTVTAFMMVSADPDSYYSFVGDAYAQGRNPASSTAELKDVLYSGQEHEAEELGAFASFLFTHNAKIGMVAFALGFAIGIPTMFLLFVNGLILGAFAALYDSRGLSLDLWGWLLPHGVTELGAVILCGGAGLVLAQCLVFPGRHTRLENLAMRGRLAGQIVLGAVVFFLIAGVIEGVFRQRVQSVPIRYTFAIGSLVLWALYFGLVGRRRQALEEAAQAAEKGT